MPITVEEKYLSRPTKDSGQGEGTEELLSVELHYLVKGTDDELLAAQAVRLQTPATHNGLERGEITLEPAGPWHWEATVQYRPPDEELEEGESSYSFDTGGGSQHITQSKQTVNQYAPPAKTAPDFKGAVGATKDGVEGVDITVPVYRFSETHVIADAKVTNAYKGRLFNLTGKTNSAEWGGFAVGEVLFLGASGSKRGRGDWEITFSFAASPNKTGLTVGDISGVAKKGWEYLWVLYEEQVDQTAQAMVKRPKAVYVEKVYDADDFAKLDPDWTE